MILEMAFVIFLGLLVFGPKKTLEMSQSVGRSIAKFRRAASEVQAQLQAQLEPQIEAVRPRRPGDIRKPDFIGSILEYRK